MPFYNYARCSTSNAPGYSTFDCAIDWTVYNLTSDDQLFNSQQSFGAVANSTSATVSWDSARTADGSVNPDGTFAYVEFVNIYQCVKGTYSACPEALGIPDGTVIEACYPTYGDQKVQSYKVYNGGIVIDIVNHSYAEANGSNPFAQPIPGLTPSAGTNVRLGYAGSVLVAGVFVAMLML